MAAGGRAVARLDDGRVVFVEGAAPGETVEAEILADKGRFLEGRVVRVLDPSPDRVEPACGHFGDCGGCSWQYLSYPAQLEAKKSILEDSLRRLARLENWPRIEIAAPDSPWGGRNRAQFQPPSLPGRPWGFFAAGTRRTVELSECPVLAPELQGAWAELAAHEADPMADRRDRSAFAWGGQGRRWIRRPSDPPGEPAQVEIGGKTLRFAVEGFFQSHLGMIPRMVEEVVGDGRGSEAWDLYSGVGLFASRLEDRYTIVHAVESDPTAGKHAPGNLVRAVHHQRGVEDWLEERLRSGSGAGPDFVVVDPPRQGMTTRALSALLALRPRSLRYVSCAHDTLARDLGQIVTKSFHLDRIVLIDLYPHTPHMEVVVSLHSTP
jgi:23S rRNA (uracil1939-C5)-methyltransferase